MFDEKVLITTLVGLTVATAAICHFNKKKETKENWWNMPSKVWKVDNEIARDRMAVAKGDFVSIPNFQASLSPRFANTNFGANILYNPPSDKNMAAPCNPLTFASQGGQQENYAREEFCGSGGCSGIASCGKGGVDNSVAFGAPLTQSNYSAGNYSEMVNSAYAHPNTSHQTDSLVPVGDMTVLDAMGQQTQPIVYDRYIYANRNSRLRSQGDWIRGDLAIVPCSAEWFRPSVQPHIDLNQGAMNVVGGWDNSTAQATAALIYGSSGNADVTIGGTDISTQLVGSSGRDGTVQISSFA